MEKVHLSKNEKYFLKKLRDNSDIDLHEEDFDLDDNTFYPVLCALLDKELVGYDKTQNNPIYKLTDTAYAYFEFNPKLKNPTSDALKWWIDQFANLIGTI